MSVIAWDGITLAADSVANDSNTKFPIEKFWSLDDDTVAAACGLVTDVNIYRMLLKEKEVGLKSNVSLTWLSSSATLVICNKKKGLIRYTTSTTPSHHGFNKVAFGSGKDFAYGAFFMGADAVQAVRAAIEFSTTCGGEVNFRKVV